MIGGAYLDRIGKQAENTVFLALNRKSLWPSEVVNVRRCSTREDAQGWDILVETSVGNIPIQVKSSETAKRGNRHRHVFVIVSRKKKCRQIADEVWRYVHNVIISRC